MRSNDVREGRHVWHAPSDNAPAGFHTRRTKASNLALLAGGNPDILDLRRLAQELAPLALRGVQPVARMAVVGPRALHVAHRGGFDDARALGGAEAPDRVHVVV